MNCQAARRRRLLERRIDFLPRGSVSDGRFFGPWCAFASHADYRHDIASQLDLQAFRLVRNYIAAAFARAGRRTSSPNAARPILTTGLSVRRHGSERSHTMAGDAAARPRKALAWAAAAFCTVQLTLAAAIEFHARGLRDPVYGRKLDQLQARLAAAPAGVPLVLALGSSQTFDGFDAELLESRWQSSSGRQAIVYNFGLPGAGPLSELLVLK